MDTRHRVATLLAALAIAILGAGCQTPVRLMPTPVSLVSGQADFFGRVSGTADPNEIPVPYVTNRLPLVEQPQPLFTALPWSQLRVGIAHVRIGDNDLDWETLHRLSTSENEDERPIIQLDWLQPMGGIATEGGSAARDDAQAFFTLLERALDASSDRNIVVYVHGANSPIPRAVAQAAQFQHFATRRVVVLSFMWPSAGSILRYLTDVGNAAASVQPFAALLQALAARTSAASINVLAYSAGAKVVSPALALLASESGEEQREALRARLRLRNVYYAAPDFDTRLFVDQMNGYIDLVQRVTISANLDDSALRFARLIHRASRAGRPDPGELDAAQSSFLVEASRQLRFDLIHVDPAAIPGLPRRSHAFWYEHPWVSSDVLGLLLFDAGPERRGLEPLTTANGVRFWTFPPDYDERIRELFTHAAGTDAIRPALSPSGARTRRP